MTGGQGIHFRDAAAPSGMRVYAIGDVHGRLDLLAEMHARIHSEIMRDRPDDWRIIHVGDYVDRGPDSRRVIDLLLEQTSADHRVVALAGNHDLAFVDFLRNPGAASLFARYGGLQTAQSYGVDADLDTDACAHAAARALQTVVPAAHLAFIEGLQRCCTFGDFFFCHAGIRPGVPLDRQDPEDLIWIRSEFHNWLEPYDKIVVHGHTPHAEPEIMGNRVNIDTGAFQTGTLTALAIDGREKRILQVSE